MTQCCCVPPPLPCCCREGRGLQTLLLHSNRLMGTLPDSLQNLAKNETQVGVG